MYEKRGSTVCGQGSGSARRLLEIGSKRKKILFRRNEPKNVLKIKELALSTPQNEPDFERQKRRPNPKMGKKRRVLAHPRACSWILGRTGRRALARAFGYLAFSGKSRPEWSAPAPAGNGKKVDG